MERSKELNASPVWQPAPRPDWVQRVNEEGSTLDLCSVVPLDEKSLLESAMRNTGLSDFGEDNWREPFRIGIKSLEEEARLNLVGRLHARSELLHALESRLRVEDTYRRHPEIDDEQIVKPIIVVGQGRSGTSFLINTLAADPDNGACRHWEMMFPCPPPEKATYLTDPRVEKAEKLIKHMYRITPEMISLHEWGSELSQECCYLMRLCFRSLGWFGVLGQAPSYEAYMVKQDPEIAYRYHRRVLKLLQWKNPRRHWVLKDVNSLDCMDAELKVYPDACFVWPHRDPVRALASMVNLVGTFYWVHSDFPMSAAVGKRLTDATMSAARLNRVIDMLEAGVVPARQIHHVHYRDLVADPIGTVGKIYSHFDVPLTARGEQGIRDYLKANPRDARPPNRVTPGTAEEIAAARKAYQRYQAYFRVPSEN